MEGLMDEGIDGWMPILQNLPDSSVGITRRWNRFIRVWIPAVMTKARTMITVAAVTVNELNIQTLLSASPTSRPLTTASDR